MITVHDLHVVWAAPKGSVRLSYEDAVAVGNATRAAIKAAHAKALADQTDPPTKHTVTAGGQSVEMTIPDALEWAAEVTRRGRTCA